MAFIPVLGTCATTLIYQVGSKQITNTLYWTQDDEFTSPGSVGALAADLVDVWDETLPATMSANVSLYGVRATALHSEDAPSVLYIPSGTHEGTAIGTPTPLHTAMSLTIRTDGRGRSRRGRLYHYGLPVEAQEDDKSWNETAVALIASKYGDLWLSMVAAGSTEGRTLVVVSREQDGVPLESGITYAVSTLDAHAPMATQRRRVKP